MRRSFDIRRFCAWLIGMTFLFSGLSKLMDPVGTSYIMKEYFHFFHLSFLDGTDTLVREENYDLRSRNICESF